MYVSDTYFTSHTHTNAHAAHTSNTSAYFNSQIIVYQKGFTAATIYIIYLYLLFLLYILFPFVLL